MNDTLQLRSVTLRASNLERSVQFYTRGIGLALHQRSGREAALSSAPGEAPLLFLVEDAAASPPPADAAGLFHSALLLPSRNALGRWLKTSEETGIHFDGFSDHRVSEAIYLSDPDGIGLEVYADRAKATWPYRNGELQMSTDPLAVPELIAAGSSYEGAPLAGSRWGHLHLRVTDLDRSEAFYVRELGVAPTVRYGSSARFLAADGYHHHLGLNTWGGVRRPQPSGRLGLVEANFAVGGIATEGVKIDPDQITLRLTPLK